MQLHVFPAHVFTFAVQSAVLRQNHGVVGGVVGLGVGVGDGEGPGHVPSSMLQNWPVQHWSQRHMNDPEMPVESLVSIHCPCTQGFGLQAPHSQRLPVYPGAQSHVVPNPVSTHCPPLRHGHSGGGVVGSIVGHVPAPTKMSPQHSNVPTLYVLVPQHAREPSSELNGKRVGYSPQHWSAGPFEKKFDLHLPCGSHP